MKFTYLLATSVALITSGSAFAADMAVRKAAPVAVVAPAPFSWTGAYVGLNAGYAWSNNSTDYSYLLAGGAADLPGFLATGIVPTSLGNSAGGFIGGGQVGYNYQVGSIVFGLEADIQYVNQKSEGSYVFGVNDGTTVGVAATSSEAQLKWLGTVRARLGFAMDRTLVYATGGLAYGGVDASTGFASYGNDIVDGPVSSLFAGGTSGTKAGWTIGAGLEYAFTNNLTFRGEYLYYDLGKATYTLAGGSSDPDNEFLGGTASYKFSGNIVRAGLNWKF